MKVEDLHGRELAAYLRGLIYEADVSGNTNTARLRIAVLAAEEIERLCAEPCHLPEDFTVWTKAHVEKAARDAAALDEIARLLSMKEDPRSGAAMIVFNVDHIRTAIERTGRKIGT